MTTKELQQTLRTLYMFAIEELKRETTVRAAYDFLLEQDLNQGVCRAISALTSSKVKLHWEWIKPHVKHHGVWWGSYPAEVYYQYRTSASVKDIITTLELRVRVLTKILGES